MAVVPCRRAAVVKVGRIAGQFAASLAHRNPRWRIRSIGRHHQRRSDTGGRDPTGLSVPPVMATMFLVRSQGGYANPRSTSGTLGFSDLRLRAVSRPRRPHSEPGLHEGLRSRRKRHLNCAPPISTPATKPFFSATSRHSPASIPPAATGTQHPTHA